MSKKSVFGRLLVQNAHLTSERKIQAEIVKFLRRVGYFVVITSTDGPQANSIAGVPDLLAFKADQVLMIECKSATGNLRPSQQAFYAAIAAHLGQHVQYVVARSLEDVLPVIGAK